MTKKITELTALTAPAIADLVEIVDDVAGTATSKKIVLSDLWKVINSFSATTSNSDDYIPIYSTTDAAIRKVLQSDLLAGAGGGGFSTGDIQYVELHNETLTTDGNFDVSSISADYDHLIFRFEPRSTLEATKDGIVMFINNDTTATNYSSYIDYTNNSQVGLGAFSNDSSFNTACPAASSLANDFGIYQCVIYNYSSAEKNKNVVFSANGTRESTEYATANGTIHWESNAAVNRITIQPDGYATEKLVTDSWLQMIGVKTTT